jgi:hypothetical protein
MAASRSSAATLRIVLRRHDCPQAGKRRRARGVDASGSPLAAPERALSPRRRSRLIGAAFAIQNVRTTEEWRRSTA